ncbi:hypothetical protein GCM10020001_063400 [Nonomuraea salmonea]
MSESRLPDPARFIPEVGEIAGAMAKAVMKGTIPQTTVHLVQLRAGQLVGNTYHAVRQTGELRAAGEAEERITAVASWRDAPISRTRNGSRWSWSRPCSLRTRTGSASPTSCSPGRPSTTTRRRCGR